MVFQRTEVDDFIATHETIFVVEQNRDAQLRSLLIIETDADDDQMVPVLHYDGMPVPSRCVIDAVSDHMAREVAA